MSAGEFDRIARERYGQVAHLCECGRLTRWVCDACWAVLLSLYDL